MKNNVRKWLLSIISEKNGKGSTKRVTGVLVLFLFIEISQLVIFTKRELPNQNLLLKILEYTFIIISVALIGITMPDIISYFRTKIPFITSTPTEEEVLIEEETTTTTTLNI